FTHWPKKAMRQINHRSHIQLEHFKLVLEIEFCKVAHRAEPGIVDEHFDLELTFFRLFQQLRRSAGFSQIERKVLCANTGQPSELVAQRDELVFGACDQQYVSSAGSEFSGKGCADSGRCSSDEGCVHQKTLLQLKQIELNYIRAACLKLVECILCRRIVEVDTGDRRCRALKHDIFHLLNVDLLCFDCVEHACEHAGPI